MTTYNTGNLVPSGNAYDRYDNSQTFDEIINKQSDTSISRTGATLTTMFGYRQQFNTLLESFGFETIHLTYVDGTSLNVDRPTQLIDRSGLAYRVKMPAAFPFMLTGNWTTDATNLTEVSDDALLRQELAQAGGVLLVNGALPVVATIAEAQALNATQYSEVFVIETLSGSGGGGPYKVVAGGTKPTDGGTILNMVGGQLELVDAYQRATVHHFGAFGTGFANDQAAVQACTNWAMTWNGVVRCPGNNYNINTGITVQSDTFRTVKFQGSGTGDAQTASSGGTTFVTNGTSTGITATFNAFVNENILIDGINFYSNAQSQTNGGCAVKLIRGPANGRYLSGFRFTNVGILGYAVGFWWQGMNTANSANNYFGSTTYQNVTITSTGMGHLQQNCSMNLLSFNSTVMLGCRFGAIVCLRDGDVGVGNGLGSMIKATLQGGTHFEGCGGLLRSDTTAVMDSGQPVRSEFTLIDFTHESCGQAINIDTGLAEGEPFGLGINTDIHVLGRVVDGISYGEVTYPYLNSTARLWCSSRMRVMVNGGKIMTPKTVNAPSIHRSIPTGSNTVITVPIAESTAYGVKSTLLLANGNGGMVESFHIGQFGGAPTRTQVAASGIGAGITLTWGAVAGANLIQLTIANASGYTYTSDLQVENLSSASILMASEY